MVLYRNGTESIQLNLDPLIDPLQRSKIIDREYYG